MDEKPRFVVVVQIESVAAHYYRVAGLGPLYLTPQDGVNTDPALARTYASKANATRSAQRAKKALYQGVPDRADHRRGFPSALRAQGREMTST